MSFGNFHYSAGSGFGEFAKAAAGMVAGARDEQDRKRKEAMELALQKLKEREATRQDAQLTLDQNKETYNEGKDLRDFNYTSGKDTRDFGETHRVNDANITNQEHDNTLGDSTLTETTRHDKALEANERNKTNVGGRWQVKLTPQGYMRVNPVTGENEPLLSSDGKQLQGAPTSSELSSESAFTALDPIFKDIKSRMTTLGHPPDMGQQFALDQSKTAPTGVMGSLENILGNKAAGKFAGDYQGLDQATTAFSTLLGQMISGQAISEAEASRLRGLIAWRAGDSPEKIQARLTEAEQIINAARVKAYRAKGLGGVPDTGGAAPAPAAQSQQDYYNSLRAKGLSADDALAQTQSKFGS